MPFLSPHLFIKYKKKSLINSKFIFYGKLHNSNTALFFSNQIFFVLPTHFVRRQNSAIANTFYPQCTSYGRTAFTVKGTHSRTGELKCCGPLDLLAHSLKKTALFRNEIAFVKINSRLWRGGKFFYMHVYF